MPLAATSVLDDFSVLSGLIVTINGPQVYPSEFGAEVLWLNESISVVNLHK